MTIDEIPEYAITRSEWEELQMVIDADNELVVLSPEEQARLAEQMKELNRLCVIASIEELIERHKVEFVTILNQKRLESLSDVKEDYVGYVLDVVNS